MDRRNFLKTGGIALLGSLTTGSAMALATPGALGGEGAFFMGKSIQDAFC